MCNSPAALPYARRVCTRRKVMARSEPIRLRESASAAPLNESRVIDARFKVVGRKRRALGIAWRACVAVFWAAVIGFLIPPAWVFFETVGGYFAGN